MNGPAKRFLMRDPALVTFAAKVTCHEADDLVPFVELALDLGVIAAELSKTICHLAFYNGLGNATSAAEAMVPVYEERGTTAEDLSTACPELLLLN